MSTSPEKNQPIKPKILVVDDEEFILMLLENILKNVFEVKMAMSGKKALEILDMGFSPNVIISDYIMPEMDGGEFLHQSAHYAPDATRILLSADTNPKTIVPVLSKAQATMYISKPFQNLELFQSSMNALNLHRITVKLRNTESLVEENDHSLLEIIEKLETKVNVLYNNLEEESKQRTQKDEEIKKLQDFLKASEKVFNDLKQEKAENEKVIQDYVSALANSENDEYLKEVSTDDCTMPRQSILALSALIRELNRFSYTDHSYAVSLLAKEICKELEFDEAQTSLTISAALLHNFPIIAMPNYFQIAYPNRLMRVPKERYFFLFNRQLRILKNICGLNGVAEIIGQLWEHNDGTGFPNHIGSNKFGFEAQVLAIANLYVFNVYKATEQDLQMIRQKHFQVQGRDINLKRHLSAVSLIKKNHAWFNHKIFDAFIGLIDNEKSSLINLIETPGKIDYRDMISMDDLEELSEVKYILDNLLVEHVDEELILDFGTSDGKNMIKIRKDIRITDLMPGMILSDGIKSDTGSIIMKVGTLMTSEAIKNLVSLAAKDMVESEIQVMVKYKK
jgi:response regulator RpfG family c-di-GMP phosphodiesterase